MILGRRLVCGDSTMIDTADKVTQKQPVDASPRSALWHELFQRTEGQQSTALRSNLMAGYSETTCAEMISFSS